MDQKKNQISLTYKTLSDRVPPNAPELERAVLGALFTESNAIHRIDLNADDFYNLNNRAIYAAIESLTRLRRGSDPPHSP